MDETIEVFYFDDMRGSYTFKPLGLPSIHPPAQEADRILNWLRLHATNEYAFLPGTTGCTVPSQEFLEFWKTVRVNG
jgi:hypothetical protein